MDYLDKFRWIEYGCFGLVTMIVVSVVIWLPKLIREFRESLASMSVNHTMNVQAVLEAHNRRMDLLLQDHKEAAKDEARRCDERYEQVLENVQREREFWANKLENAARE